MSPNRQTVAAKDRPSTIVLTGGGSGGHIIPVLSLARALKKHSPDTKLVYVGLRGEKIEGLEEDFKVFDKLYRVSSGKFRRYHGESLLSHLLDLKTLLLNFRDLFKVAAGLLQSIKVLNGEKPDLVFSKGGFVAVPVGLAARLLTIPIATHDSDASAGLANRILGRWAVVHATGMPPEHYSYPSASTHYVGIPVSEKIKPVTDAMQAEFKRQIGFSDKDQLLLIGGAGHGARDINNLILGIASDLLNENASLNIVHLAGVKHQKEVGEKYSAILSEELLPRVKVLGFSDEFYKYTGAADVVITRAGASTIAELAVQKKPTILIPAPFLAGGHQLDNARQLQKMKAVELLPNDVESQKMLEVINGLLNNTTHRKSLSDNIGKLAKPDAADKLAELLIKKVQTKESSS